MAASLESRVPFLDHRLVEWAVRLPAEVKMKRLQTKPIVKNLGLQVLPKEVVHRRKSGFGVPMAAWLRDSKGMGRYLELFSDSSFKQRGYIKAERAQQLAKEHLTGKADHSDLLWELINLELWHRSFFNGDS